MAYLHPGDYRKSIQSENLQQVIGGIQSVLADAEETAIEECKSHLAQKYIIDREFTDTRKWDITETYEVFDRVYLDPAPFSATHAYIQGDLVVFTPTNSKEAGVYISINGSAAHAFNPTEWNFACYQYQVFSVPPLKPEFQYQAAYKPGDVVFWKGLLYSCQIAPERYVDLQRMSVTSQVFPFTNVFPDDPVNGLQYWGQGIEYNIHPGTNIFDNSSWAMKDSRSKIVVWCVCALALYLAHERIAPRNIPDLRVKAYDDAIKKLKGFAKGDTTAVALPMIQPKSGYRVRWGGNVKNNNTW